MTKLVLSQEWDKLFPKSDKMERFFRENLK